MSYAGPPQARLAHAPGTIRIGVCWLALMLMGPLPVTPALPQNPGLGTPRKNVNIVSVVFTVRDAHGALVANLSKDSFEVLEDGRPQTIKYFSAETDLPLTLGLVIDTSGSMQRMLPEEKIVAADFLRQVITEKDLAFVMSFDISVDLLQDLTSDGRLLRSGLEKARINVGGGAHPKGTLLFDAIYLASDEILGKQVGRKAMVILTDGTDEGSRLKLADAIAAAQKADAICYVLLLSDPQYGSDRAAIAALAEETGGRMIAITRPEDIGIALAHMARELRSQYSLAYSPENDKRDGTFRKIEIKAKPGYKVQARTGYYAPKS